MSPAGVIIPQVQVRLSLLINVCPPLMHNLLNEIKPHKKVRVIKLLLYVRAADYFRLFLEIALVVFLVYFSVKICLEVRLLRLMIIQLLLMHSGFISIRLRLLQRAEC